MPIPIYILASAKDAAHREELEKQLTIHRELLSHWSSSDILAGEALAPAIEERLRASRIAVWLISPDFRFAEEPGAEARRALELEQAGVLRIVPVLVRVTTHYRAPYLGRPVLPDNKVPVANWNDRDLAWRNVVAGIRKAAEEIAGVAPSYVAFSPGPPGATPLPTSAPNAPSVSLAPVSAPPVSVPIRDSKGPQSPRSAAFLPPSVRESDAPRVPAPAPPDKAPRTRVSPAPSGWRRVSVLLALVLVGIAVFWISRGSPGEPSGPSEQSAPHIPSGRAATPTAVPSPGPSTVESPAPVPTATVPPPDPSGGVCCGGVDCPKERQQPLGTSCEKDEVCRSCRSGRKLVSGACASRLPSTNQYRLRLAGASLATYVPGKTDTICVQLPGSTPVCARVSDAMARPLLGLVRIGDLTSPRGIDVWFLRGTTPMWGPTGVSVSPAKGYFMNSALCVGAVLYATGTPEILRFYLEEP